MDPSEIEIDVFVSKLVATGLPHVQKVDAANGEEGQNDVFLKVAATKELYARTATQWTAGSSATYDFNGKYKNDSDNMRFKSTIGELENSEIDGHAFDETKHSADVLISEGTGRIDLKGLKNGKTTETVVVNIPLQPAGMMAVTFVVTKTARAIAAEKAALKKKRDDEAAAAVVSNFI